MWGPGSMDNSPIPDSSPFPLFPFSPFRPDFFLDGLIVRGARLTPEGQVRRKVKPGNANVLVSKRKPGDYS